MKNPSMAEIREVEEFCRSFVERAEEEFPRLRVITAIYTGDTWQECKSSILSKINRDYPGATSQSLEEVGSKSGSMAIVLDPDFGEKKLRVAVMRINLDDCCTGYWGDPVTEAKSVVAHEGGHIVGKLIRGQHNSLFEENAADIFEMLLMSSMGYEENHQALLKMRILNRSDPGKLGVYGRYGFPAIYDEAAELSKKYFHEQGSGVSLMDILQESDEFVEQREKTLNAWFGFIDGIYALAGETKSPEDIIGAAVKANHPHAAMISQVSGFKPNMDFEPAHAPNPFISRRAALDYPSSFNLMAKAKVVDAPINRHAANPAEIEWPSGYALLLPDGGTLGTYDLHTQPYAEPETEPHFS
ncbi:MAG: hypothetical protein KA099_11560 [Alphaproteobacteria bacterium]|nr:hypothetical protein [Alphaproteobacteria bacterium]MBP7760111.1 hypothetical protein [Alphaproteobacteria bacterium]MBP7763480.1 hypothetical protein [Alphaproteobacteria bacterium]MBP7905948.1 hypothetical protein [Alphaproteobacteria bacterium]